MKCNRQLFCHLGSFFAFYPTPPPFPPPPNNPKNEDIKKMKKKPGYIILHKCTENHDMLYCSHSFLPPKKN